MLWDLEWPGSDWLQRGAEQINPLPNQLHISSLSVSWKEPAGNAKWYLWPGIMTYRLAGLENTNITSWIEFVGRIRSVKEGGWIHLLTRVFFSFRDDYFFHKPILSSHILLVVNRIMMVIIFTNLSEKKKLMSRPSTSPFSVNAQFQESFLWDKGGWDVGVCGVRLAWSQNSKRKNIFIFSGDSLALLLEQYQM